MKMKKLNRRGFTMAELLIVVAIIAVLVAVAIPTFNTQLEKSREATDVANLRSAYAEALAVAMSSDKGEGTSSSYKVQQKTSGWQNVDLYASTPEILKTAITSTKKDTGWNKRNTGDFKVTVKYDYTKASTPVTVEISTVEST